MNNNNVILNPQKYTLRPLALNGWWGLDGMVEQIAGSSYLHCKFPFSPRSVGHVPFIPSQLACRRGLFAWSPRCQNQIASEDSESVISISLRAWISFANQAFLDSLPSSRLLSLSSSLTTGSNDGSPRTPRRTPRMTRSGRMSASGLSRSPRSTREWRATRVL